MLETVNRNLFNARTRSPALRTMQPVHMPDEPRRLFGVKCELSQMHRSMPLVYMLESVAPERLTKRTTHPQVISRCPGDQQ